MGFSGIGIWEILVILVVALLVLGPNKLPGIARTLGKTVRAIKKASADLTANITREVELTKNEPPPSKEASNISNSQAPSAENKTKNSDQNNQPTKPEGQQPRNE
jgi:Tat protein translocase TatB subunit